MYCLPSTIHQPGPAWDLAKVLPVLAIGVKTQKLSRDAG
jgi:hypothetical protein